MVYGFGSEDILIGWYFVVTNNLALTWHTIY